MLNHCLLSVDDSEEWENLLAFLPAMSRLLKIEHLTLVYVVNVAEHHSAFDTEQTAEKRLEALATRLQGQLGIQVDCSARRGLPAAETLRAAKLLKADAVIICNRSHSASRDLFLGNTALYLARLSPIPLLILPLDGDIPSLDAPVTLATDCSRGAQKAQDQFVTLVEAGARGMVLSVTDPHHEQEPGTPAANIGVDAIANRYPNVEALELTGHPVERILTLAEEEKTPLIILGRRGNTPIRELLLGSTAEAICRASRRPVLLVPG